MAKSHGEHTTLAMSLFPQGKGKLETETETNCLLVLRYIAERCNCERRDLQAPLRDIAGLVPDHRNQANIAMKSHKVFGFPELINIMFTLYCCLLSVQ